MVEKETRRWILPGILRQLHIIIIRHIFLRKLRAGSCTVVGISVPKTSNETWCCTNYYQLGKTAVKQGTNVELFWNAESYTGASLRTARGIKSS